MKDRLEQAIRERSVAARKAGPNLNKRQRRHYERELALYDGNIQQATAAAEAMSKYPPIR